MAALFRVSRRRVFRASRAASASARRDQNSVCSLIQSSAAANPSGRMDSQCSRPRTTRWISPADSRTLTWRETPANVIGSGAARSVIRASPARSAMSRALRVGSASAA